MTVVDLECRVPTWRVAIRAENGAVHVPLEALKHHEARQAQEKLLLGHSRVAMTLDIYSHVSLELEKRVADRLNAALRG
jgi:hypothetical protein